MFLNKNDLFEKKIQHSDIKNYFPVGVAALAFALVLIGKHSGL